eukprot:gene13749-biopygen5295
MPCHRHVGASPAPVRLQREGAVAGVAAGNVGKASRSVGGPAGGPGGLLAALSTLRQGPRAAAPAAVAEPSADCLEASKRSNRGNRWKCPMVGSRIRGMNGAHEERGVHGMLKWGGREPARRHGFPPLPGSGAAAAAPRPGVHYSYQRSWVIWCGMHGMYGIVGCSNAWSIRNGLSNCRDL